MRGFDARMSASLDRYITGNYGEDSVWSEQEENAHIGELVSRLVQVGTLLLDTGENPSSGEEGVYVQWWDESTLVQTWIDFHVSDGGLIEALEKVDRDVSLIANYG